MKMLGGNIKKENVNQNVNPENAEGVNKKEKTTKATAAKNGKNREKNSKPQPAKKRKEERYDSNNWWSRGNFACSFSSNRSINRMFLCENCTTGTSLCSRKIRNLLRHLVSRTSHEDAFY